MAGRAVFADESYYQDAKHLLERGYTRERVARDLGMSRKTLYRLLTRYGYGRR